MYVEELQQDFVAQVLRHAFSMTKELSVAHALTWRYMIALSLVATLSTAAWVSLHLVISEQKSTAAVVNVSGRQRMLSQRTALYSNLLLNTHGAERAVIRGKLREAIDLMARSHRGLTHGDNEMGLPASMSPAVRSMYFDGPNALDVQVETYIKTVHALLLLDDNALTPENPQLQYIIRVAPTTLVTALDQMVRQYQLEGEASVGGLQKAETIFWVVTLLLLMLEALLIFHPFVRHVRTIIGKLQRVTDELQLHQDNLEALVRQRTAELESRSEALIESEEKFRLISTSAQDAITIIGPDEQVIYWNPAAEKIFGYQADEVMGMNLHTLLTSASYHAAAHIGFEHFRHFGEGPLIGKTFEITALRKNGEEFPIELSISAVRLQNSWHALGIIRDVTERKLTENSLRESEEKLRGLYELSPLGIALTDLAGRYIEFNKAFQDICGYPKNELDVLDYWTLTPRKYEEDEARQLESLHKTGRYGPYVKEYIRKDGSLIPIQLTGLLINGRDGKKYIWSIVEDITERKLAEDQIRNLAFYDTLTQLPNRRLLNDRLDQTMAACKRSVRYGALMFLDLDNFKPLNDLHGHNVGDLLLIEVARRISSCVREVDTVARFGGDEFVVMISELDVDKAASIAQANIVAEKICATLADPYLLTVSQDGKAQSTVEHHCTASIGVVVFNHHADREDILRWADMAMYAAKNGGRNRVVIHQQDIIDVSAINQDVAILRLNWHESYDCGESTIDQEHRKLFDLANTLIESAFARNEKPEIFDSALEKLLAHVIQHFADEEAILARYQYIDLEEHTHAHRMLIEHALRLRDDAAAGGVTIGELVNFIANEVIAQHMLKADRKFYSLFKRVPPARNK